MARFPGVRPDRRAAEKRAGFSSSEKTRARLQADLYWNRKRRLERHLAGLPQVGGYGAGYGPGYG